ncbi:hypothetical protein [Sphingomonas rubra]|uniref:Protein mom n=1 Tax=Sphingomonas rubra TaxID=634430 RepID=A0A1I5RUQ0_9SPHN|nr:hypothetical protein [Sphingomonas rubra]SFP62265.1 hypothetical protein SAMN04488241_104140 [Sphingomonas rubra]
MILPTLSADFTRPRGAAGETTGYLFPNGGGDAVGFGDAAFAVGLLDRRIANELIIANHYSRRVYSASTLHLGVWIHGELVGVLQYGYAMNPASAGSVVTGTAMNEYLELNRMWLDDAAPRNSESKALAYSVRFIRRARPTVKWVQSFADERCGLFGTVYQAAGFTFHGEHRGIFWELDGDWYHNSLMTNSRTAASPRAAHLLANRDRAVRHHLRQFRYLRFLQQRFAKGCRHPVRPFPKPDYAARPVDERGTTACEDGGTPSGRSSLPAPAA